MGDQHMVEGELEMQKRMKEIWANASPEDKKKGREEFDRIMKGRHPIAEEIWDELNFDSGIKKKNGVEPDGSAYSILAIRKMSLDNTVELDRLINALIRVRTEAAMVNLIEKI